MRKALELTTSNIPIMNLRNEFEDYLMLFRSNNFKESVFNSSIRHVEMPSMSWHGLPNDLLTLILQRSILGLECYVSAAVDYELTREQKQTEQAKAAVKNPFSLSKNVVVAVYDKLPAKVAEEYMLSVFNQTLFNDLKQLYKQLRNPLFHGGQVSMSCPDLFEKSADCFELFAEVYNWVDTWYSAFPTHYKGTKPIAL